MGMGWTLANHGSSRARTALFFSRQPGTSVTLMEKAKKKDKKSKKEKKEKDSSHSPSPAMKGAGAISKFLLALIDLCAKDYNVPYSEWPGHGTDIFLIYENLLILFQWYSLLKGKQ